MSAKALYQWDTRNAYPKPSFEQWQHWHKADIAEAIRAWEFGSF